MGRSTSHCSGCHQYSAHFPLGPFTVVAHIGSHHTYSPTPKAGSSKREGHSQATGIYPSISKQEIPANLLGEGSLIPRLGCMSMTSWVLLSSAQLSCMPCTVSRDLPASLSQCRAPWDFAWYHNHFLTPYLFLLATLHSKVAFVRILVSRFAS